MSEQLTALRKFLKDLGYDFENLSAVQINQILTDMTAKLNRVPTLLTDEEFQRMERERAETKETRSNWIRRNKLNPVENRGGKRPNAGRKLK